MSDSAESIAGEAGEPIRNLQDDIDAEIADHLALSAQAAAQAGVGGEDAFHAAQAKFGSVNRVRFQCWWVNRGDLVMRKATIYGGLVLLVGLLIAGVALPTIASLRSVRDNVEQLTTQLAALTKAQQDLIEKQSAAQAPVELKGKCYLKTEDVPAVGADVEIWNADEMKLIRHVRTDEKGEFSSGYLAAGMYFALVPFPSKVNAEVPWEAGSQKGWGPRFAVQSEPIPLHVGARSKAVALNVYFPVGDIGFRLSETLTGSGTVQDMDIKYVTEVMIICLAEQETQLPYDLISSPAPSSWPLAGVRRSLSGTYPIQPRDWHNDQLVWLSSRRRSDEYVTSGALAGKYSVGALMYVANVSSTDAHSSLMNARSQAWRPGTSDRTIDKRIMIDVKDNQQTLFEIAVPSQSKLDEMLTERMRKETESKGRKYTPLVLYQAALDVKQVATEHLDEARVIEVLQK